MKILPKLVDFILILTSIICLIGIAYITIKRGATSENYLLLFFLFLTALLSFLLFRFSKPEIKNVATLTILSSVSAVYVAELYYIFSNSNGVAIEYSSEHDHRTMREVLSELNSSGLQTAVPIIYPSYLITRPDLFIGKKPSTDGKTLYPLSGISLRKTVLCNEGGYWATYSSDEFGFRNPKGIWNKTVDIAVVGDSFSHGNCVNDGDDWVSIIRKKYPNTINLGMGGNGPLYELATIKEYLTSVKPKVVIWQYFEANETRITAEYAIPMLRRYLTERDFRQDSMSKQVDIDLFLEQIAHEAMASPKGPALHSKITSFIFLEHLRVRFGIHALVKGQQKTNMLILGKALAEGKRVVESWGGVLYFVYLPSALGLTSTVSPDWYATREEVISSASSEGLRIIDLYPAFKKNGDPLYFFPYRAPLHYNEEGYGLVANVVMKNLP